MVLTPIRILDFSSSHHPFRSPTTILFMITLQRIMLSNRYVLFVFVLILSFSPANAQRFIFGDMFKDNNGKDWQNTTGKPQTFSSNKSVYGHHWELQTDGCIVIATNEIKGSLHIGKGESQVGTVILTSTTDFENVDIVWVNTLSGKNYILSVWTGGQLIESKNIKGREDGPFLFSANGASGVLKVEMKYAKPLKQAMYVYYIEAASLLSDRQPLLQQHVKPGNTYSYQVQRTFASNHWNTICLPFDVSQDALTEAMKENCALREFTKKVENNVLKFENAVAIKAGVPYLIKPKKEVKNPIFSNVVYKKDAMPQTVQDETGQYAFVGTFDPVNLSVDGSDLFLLATGNLAKPKSKELSEMYGMRAYFKINEQTSSSAKQITYAIDCGSETVNGIQSLPSHPSTLSQHIYNLQGVEVGTDIHHLPAGVYVIGGKKIIKR